MRAFAPSSAISTRRSRKQSGFALVTVAFSIVSLVGAVGLGVDIGRMYIAKNEAQLFADSAALAAALELDGTPGGVLRARRAVSANANRHALASAAFADPLAEFAAQPDGPFLAQPKFSAGLRFVRVTAAAPVDIYFLRVTGSKPTSIARASAVGGQIEKTTFAEGLFPFTASALASTPDFGWTTGTRYPIQFFEPNSDAVIRQAILSEAQTRPVTLGDALPPTPGIARETLLQALRERIDMDADPDAGTYAAYNGNGRRLVALPVTSADAPAARVEGFAAFFLLPASEYKDDGALQAEYLGPYVQGSRYRGGAPDGPGAYVVRLVQ